MGCGPSNSASVLEERVQEGIPSIPLDDSKLESLSNTPDHFSEQVDPPNGPPPVEVPKLVSPKLENGDVTNSFVDDIEGSPIVSGQGGVAFNVADDGMKSLIKRHPPKKFQKLEDIQQGPALTQEQLKEKQAYAEKRRQEIINQRVQSAKQRSAKSAKVRAKMAEQHEVEQFLISEEIRWKDRTVGIKDRPFNSLGGDRNLASASSNSTLSSGSPTVPQGAALIHRPLLQEVTSTW